MRWERDVQIQDLRDHPRELVVELGNLLASGSEAIPDPKHPELFEIKSDTHVFYVHISPITGKVPPAGDMARGKNAGRSGHRGVGRGSRSWPGDGCWADAAWLCAATT